MLNYIRTTTNKSGLRVDAVRVTKQYQTGVKISQEQMDDLKLIFNKVLPKWNYDIDPKNSADPVEIAIETCISEPC